MRVVGDVCAPVLCERSSKLRAHGTLFMHKYMSGAGCYVNRLSALLLLAIVW
jgi:hypothetical protein